MGEREFLRFDEAATRALGDIAGLRVADMGAGAGAITRRLAKLGGDVTGVEPNPEAAARALESGGGPSYVVAPAETTGLRGGAFDLVFFSNSLHHAEDMGAALAEARRLLRDGGRIAIMEPEADDPLYPALKLVDDEKPLYAAAQRAIDGFTGAGEARREATLFFAMKYRVGTADEMLANMIGVDSRRSLAETDRPAFTTAFDAALRSDERGGYVPSWERLDVLALA